jgi:hypothetical protein
MKTIYKFGPVTPYFDCVVQGRIVHVGMQSNNIYVWAEQNVSTEVCSVYYVGTGHNYSDDHQHVGTVFEGLFVWHVIKKNI